MSENKDDATQTTTTTPINERLASLEHVVAKLSNDLKSRDNEASQLTTLLGRLGDLETALKEQHTAIADSLLAMQHSLETVVDSSTRWAPNPAQPSSETKSAVESQAKVVDEKNENTPPSRPSPSPLTTKTDNKKAVQEEPESTTTPKAATPTVQKTTREAYMRQTSDERRLPYTRRESVDGGRNNSVGYRRRRLDEEKKSPLGPLGGSKDANPMSPRIQPTRRSGGAATMAMQAARREMQRAAARAAQEARDSEETGMLQYFCWILIALLGIGAMALGVIAMSMTMKGGEPGLEILTEL